MTITKLNSTLLRENKHKQGKLIPSDLIKSANKYNTNQKEKKLKKTVP
jgi:hypothetical protein